MSQNTRICTFFFQSLQDQGNRLQLSYSVNEMTYNRNNKECLVQTCYWKQIKLICEKMEIVVAPLLSPKKTKKTNKTKHTPTRCIL